MTAIITACICFYNAAAELERCLESLDLGSKKKDGIDYAICVDGKYPNFRGNSRLSNDGSRQVVNNFPHTILVDHPDYEIHKRNRYLKYTEHTGTDYIFIIDSDEYVEEITKDWTLFRRQLEGKHNLSRGHDIWGIDVEENAEDYHDTVNQILGKVSQPKRRSWEREFAPKPRIWYHPWQFEYFLNHYTWRHKDPNYPEYSRESVFSIAMWDTIPGIRLMHDHKLRSKEYLDKRLDYHRWLIQFEQQKVLHYFKHHDHKPLPHNLSKVEKWVDQDVLKNKIKAS